MGCFRGACLPRRKMAQHNTLASPLAAVSSLPWARRVPNEKKVFLTKLTPAVTQDALRDLFGPKVVEVYFGAHGRSGFLALALCARCLHAPHCVNVYTGSVL